MRCALVSLALIFSACQTAPEVDPPADFDPASWIAQGQSAAATTFSVMSARLEATIAADGVEGALEYCNVAAYPLTDSMSTRLDAKIRRTTLAPRNPENAPSDRERAVLEAYQTAFENGETLEPVAVPGPDGSVYFHAPIITKAVCTNCHGVVGQTLTELNYALIQEMYPDDQATGYSVDQLRGMWSITFRGDQ